MRLCLWIATLATVLFAFGCAEEDSLIPGPGSHAVDTLLTNLEFPLGLCLHGDSIYFTETAGRNTVYGGKVALSVYNIAAGTKTQLTNPIQYPEGIAYEKHADILYAVGYIGSLPGDQGGVSIIGSTGLEMPYTTVEIAATDVLISDGGDMYIIGSSDNPSAKSLYRFPAGHYNNPMVLQNGLGRVTCLAMDVDTMYIGGVGGIRKIVPGGVPVAYNDALANSLSSFVSYLFYVSTATGEIGRIDLLSGAKHVLLSNSKNPTAVRYHAGKHKLYFLEGGTDANHYKDGRLLVLNNPI